MVLNIILYYIVIVFANLMCFVAVKLGRNAGIIKKEIVFS
jgi:hypothetical protein